jgi:hypothetical protein
MLVRKKEERSKEKKKRRSHPKINKAKVGVENATWFISVANQGADLLVPLLTLIITPFSTQL